MHTYLNATVLPCSAGTSISSMIFLLTVFEVVKSKVSPEKAREAF